MRKGSSWPPDKGIGVGATLEGRRCDFEGRRAASSCIRQLLVWRRWATARAPSPAPPPDNVGLPIAKLSKRVTWYAHCFEGARGRANRVNFYHRQTQNNQSRLWKFGGCKGAMLKRLKKEIVILFNIFLGLHLCTSEFSQSIFGCSRVCERRVCRIRPRVCKGFESGASKSEDFGRVATASMVLVLLRSRFATEICIMANGIGFGPA